MTKLTLKHAKQTLRATGVKLSSNPSYGEYSVVLVRHTLRPWNTEAFTYYTNDLQDAYNTGLDMAARELSK